MDTLASIVKQIAKETGLAPKHVESVIQLLEDGNTVPFIARYRKEQTGSMDEVQIQTISERWGYIQHLNQRKDEVIRLIDEQGKLTGQLKLDIEKADKLQEVEDLYRPFKQNENQGDDRQSKGLEPLADFIISLPRNEDVAAEARKYINEEKEVMSAEEALEGAKNILAERISDEPEYRKWIRQETFKRGTLKSAAKDAEADEKKIYEMYYEYEEPIQKSFLIAYSQLTAAKRGDFESVGRAAGRPHPSLLGKTDFTTKANKCSRCPEKRDRRRL